MYSRTLLDILFLIWGQTVADYKMLSCHLSINVIIIVASFKILDLCPIALFQQLWNTLYIHACSAGSTVLGRKFSFDSIWLFMICSGYFVKIIKFRNEWFVFSLFFGNILRLQFPKPLCHFWNYIFVSRKNRENFCGTIIFKFENVSETRQEFWW